jgi:transposase-like protein
MGDRRGRYSVELRQRAVRLVVESRSEYESEWAAISSIAASWESALRRRYAHGCVT